MTTVKLSVAKLISKNAVMSNYDIERVNGEHPLSGLRKMRELKKEFKDKYPKLTAYTFGNNKYAFKKMFQVFCARQVENSVKNVKDHEIKYKTNNMRQCITKCPHKLKIMNISLNVGSYACASCKYFKSIRYTPKGKSVICSYPKKGVVK